MTENNNDDLIKESMKSLDENLNKSDTKTKDIENISLECKCSIATVYNYIGGKQSNIHLAKAIIESGNKILISKGISI